jgi:hypothetical protein
MDAGKIQCKNDLGLLKLLQDRTTLLGLGHE